MTDTVLTARTATTEHPVLEILAERWSPRAFTTGTPIDEGKLSSALEAARWAPSAYNAQPWRFLVGRAGTEAFTKILDSLVEFNQGWAVNAGALVVAVAETVDAQGNDVAIASYDLGQAIAHFSVQAHADGLHVHQMSGFDAAALADSFGLPSGLVPVTVTAVGEIGDPAQLNEMLREREGAPRERKSIADIVLINE